MIPHVVSAAIAGSAALQLLDRQNSNAAAGPSKSSSRPLGRQRNSINYSLLAGNRKLDAKVPGSSTRAAKRAVTSPALYPSLKCARTRLLWQWLLQSLKASFAFTRQLFAFAEALDDCLRSGFNMGSNALLLAAALRFVLSGSKMGARLADVYHAMPSVTKQAVLTQICLSARLRIRLHVAFVC